MSINFSLLATTLEISTARARARGSRCLYVSIDEECWSILLLSKYLPPVSTMVVLSEREMRRSDTELQTSTEVIDHADLREQLPS